MVSKECEEGRPSTANRRGYGGDGGGTGVGRPVIDCIIPAKGRSRRLPGKNKAQIGGRYILGEVIHEAIQSRIFRSVSVSTDDGDIAYVASTYGARVYPRSAHLAEDHVTVHEVVKAWIEKEAFYLDHANAEAPPDYVAIIHPTAWGLLSEDIQGMWRKLESTPNAQGIMATVDPLEHPDGALARDIHGWSYLMLGERLGHEQEMPHLEMDAGYCYIYPTEGFIQRGFYPDKLLKYTLPRSRVVDINTAGDLFMASVLAATMEKWKK